MRPGRFALQPCLVRDLEARGGIEPPVKVLQTYALPLGYRATEAKGNRRQQNSLWDIFC
jgi:hypothetical protein